MDETHTNSGPEDSGDVEYGADRRNFLKTAAVVAGGMAAACAGPGGESSPTVAGTVPIPQDQPPVDASRMPMTRIGDVAVSRLVIGANQMWGFSHRGKLLSNLMMEYYTAPQIIKVLRYCESVGINTWQTGFGSRHQGIQHRQDRVVETWRMLQESGSTLNVIVLATPQDFDDERAWKLLLEMGPTAIVHHGNVTDRAWVENRMPDVQDALKKFRDAGVLVGCSMHTPEAMAWVEDAGWDLDFYMASFYRASRKLRDHWTDALEREPLHEIYLEGIPDLMCPVIRQVQKPVLAYKVLAAGRLADNTTQIERAFEYAFDNIKPQDGVIIGMFPKYRDEVAESAHLTIKYGQV